MVRIEDRRRFLASSFTTCITSSLAMGVAGQSCVAANPSAPDPAPAWNSTSFQTQFPAMGSLLKIVWEDEGDSRKEVLERAKQFDQGARDTAEHWNSILSDYDDDSESSNLTRHADDLNWHSVSNDLASVLNEVEDWYQLSMGAFDASLGAMTRLRRRRRLPSERDWGQAKERVGWQYVEWDRKQSRLRFRRSGVRFDFGAIGKGWVADRISELFASQGVHRFLINFAGNMRIGKPPIGKTGWPVSIDAVLENAPEQEPAELLRLSLSQCGISTSGDRWQRLPDASSPTSETRTSHIMDPRVGLGIASPQSVTIIADNATRADAASTATSVHLNGNRSGWLDRLSASSGDFRWLIQIVENREIRLLHNL